MIVKTLSSKPYLQNPIFKTLYFKTYLDTLILNPDTQTLDIQNPILKTLSSKPFLQNPVFTTYLVTFIPNPETQKPWYSNPYPLNPIFKTLSLKTYLGTYNLKTDAQTHDIQSPIL